MNRVQRVLGYVGALLLLAGVVITAGVPAEFGVADPDAASVDGEGTVTGAEAPAGDGAAAEGTGTGTETPSNASGAADVAPNRTASTPVDRRDAPAAD